MATAVTPGLLDSWSITARLNAPTDAVAGYCAKGSWKPAIRAWSPRKPGSTCCIFCKLRRKTPERVSSTSAMATSETTNAERNHVWLALPPICAPSLRLSIKLIREAAKAGARLQRTPAATATTSANPATMGFIETESMRGMESGIRCKVVRIAIGEHQTEQATSHAQQESFHQGF